MVKIEGNFIVHIKSAKKKRVENTLKLLFVKVLKFEIGERHCSKCTKDTLLKNEAKQSEGRGREAVPTFANTAAFKSLK